MTTHNRKSYDLGKQDGVREALNASEATPVVLQVLDMDRARVMQGSVTFIHLDGEQQIVGTGTMLKLGSPATNVYDHPALPRLLADAQETIESLRADVAKLTAEKTEIEGMAVEHEKHIDDLNGQLVEVRRAADLSIAAIRQARQETQRTARLASPRLRPRRDDDDDVEEL